MSRENVDMVRRGLDAWNRGDLDAVLKLMHPEVELTPVIAQLVEGGDSTYRGTAGVESFWADWRVAWNFEFGELDIRDLGDTVLVIGQVSVTSQTSGMDLDTAMAAVFSVEDGRVIRMISYLDVAEALEAVGLAE